MKSREKPAISSNVNQGGVFEVCISLLLQYVIKRTKDILHLMNYQIILRVRHFLHLLLYYFFLVFLCR